MTPDIPTEVALRILRSERATRWERAELGRDLRRCGWSYGEIANELGVSQGTVARWCRGISLASDQVRAVRLRTGSKAGVPRDTQRKRRRQIADIEREAAAYAASRLSDPLWLIGTALYWAEGDKSSRRLSMANTDEAVLRSFIRWVDTYHEAGPYVLAIHLHEGNDAASAVEYWRMALDLADAEAYRPYVKPRGTGHRKNRLPHGVCTVRLRRSTDAWLRTMTWISVLSAHFAGLDDKVNC